MADYKTLGGLDLDIGGFTESVTRSRKTLEEVSRKNRGIGAKPETEEVELDSNFLEGIAQLFIDNGYEPKQPNEDDTTTPKDKVLDEYSELMKSEIIQDAMKEISTLGESPNKLEDIYTSMDTDFVTLENQPTVDSEGELLEIGQTEPLGLMSKVSPVVTSDKPIMAETPSQPDLKADVDSEILSPTFLNAIGITGSLTEEGVQTEVKRVLKEQGMSDEEIANIVNKSLEEKPTNAQDTSDSNDADGGAASGKAFDDTVKAFLERNEGNENTPYQDTLGNWTVGIGHYIGKTLPERFKNADGTPKTLTDNQVKILFEKDYKEHKEDAARLPMYSQLDNKGKQALIDLTFNMGNEVFNENKWPKFFAALQNKDLKTAAKELKNSKWYDQVGNRAPRVIKLIKGAKFI